MVALIDDAVDRIDGVQRRHGLLAFPFAVFKRYGEDNGGWVGALISYYGFFSLFPLLVVVVTVATWVLGDEVTDALSNGRAAVGALVADSQAPLVSDKLGELGGGLATERDGRNGVPAAAVRRRFDRVPVAAAVAAIGSSFIDRYPMTWDSMSAAAWAESDSFGGALSIDGRVSGGPLCRCYRGCYREPPTPGMARSLPAMLSR